MFESLGRVIYRRRRWVVALAVAFVVFAGVWGTGVFSAMTGGGFEDPDSDSSCAATSAARELSLSGSSKPPPVMAAKTPVPQTPAKTTKATASATTQSRLR